MENRMTVQGIEEGDLRNMSDKAIGEYFPFWNTLTAVQRQAIAASSALRRVDKGTVVHNGSQDCVGLLLVNSGRLRAFVLSDEGKEITLYRLLERDICLFSASCMMNSIQFDIVVEAEEPTSFWQIPAPVYQGLMRESAAVANYTNELMASRFSDVMWVMDQILNKKMDARLAAFLLEESTLQGSDSLPLTHEEIAHHLGSAREVITRLLKYLQEKGLVTLFRGGVTLADKEQLAVLAADSLR